MSVKSHLSAAVALVAASAPAEPTEEQKAEWLSRVKQDGWDLYHVPEQHRTPEICIEAVKRYGWDLYHVPEQHRTPEICMEAVKRYGWALSWVPAPLRTYEACMVAIKQDGRSLRYVPEHHKTPELCRQAVSNQSLDNEYSDNGFALEYVPEHLKTPELCLTAFRCTPGAYRFIDVAQLRQPGSEQLCKALLEILEFLWENHGDEYERLSRAIDEMLAAKEGAPQVEMARA